jgi:phosphotransferase system enzyme I (PtsI)
VSAAAPAAPAPARPVILSGRPASPGFAAGPLVVQAERVHGRRRAGTPADERAALTAALATAAADLATLAAEASGDAADILEFQIALIEDDALSGPAMDAIKGGTPAERAWSEAIGVLIADYEATEDDYFRARAADLRDLSERVAMALSGEAQAGLSLPEGAVLFATDLAPSRFLAADWSGRGIALSAGSATSHVAMLARARGVPMVTGLGALGAGARAGVDALLDGEAGTLTLSPDAAATAAFADHRRKGEAAAVHAAAAATGAAVTADGVAIAVHINVADPAELDRLDPAICDGIGLVRTELLFHARDGLPDEAEQTAVYRRILAWAAGRPVTIRSLDAGGDKPIPGYTLDGETNPFLGLRGVRLSLARPEVFAVQLRALLAAATDGDLKVMIPMVSVPAEMARVRAAVAEAAAALSARGVPYRVPPIGMMVEVPAAALALDAFDTDFVSIGSNDLTQYTLAAGRDEPSVAALADTAEPAVLRLIAMTVAAANARAIPVSLCGDAGGDPRLVPLLLAAGLRSLSMAPSAVGRVKQTIAGLSLRATPAPTTA